MVLSIYEQKANTKKKAVQNVFVQQVLLESIYRKCLQKTSAESVCAECVCIESPRCSLFCNTQGKQIQNQDEFTANEPEAELLYLIPLEVGIRRKKKRLTGKLFVFACKCPYKLMSDT